MLIDPRQPGPLPVILFLFGLTVIALILTTPGCGTLQMPSLKITTWSGDSKTQAVVRSQSGQSVSCSDPLFDDMICMSYEDIKQLYQVFSKCKAWSN